MVPGERFPLLPDIPTIARSRVGRESGLNVRHKIASSRSTCSPATAPCAPQTLNEDAYRQSLQPFVDFKIGAFLASGDSGIHLDAPARPRRYELVRWDVDLGPNGYRCSTLSQALPEQLLVLPHISVLARPETRKRLIDQGFQVRELPADKFAAFIAAERAKWAKSA